ncbi:MAG: CRTAC1 family protein [Deltaproteobacteria bacterium]|nr:CRTAC1 family protein [Deltaproteobacteria bacterium]
MSPRFFNNTLSLRCCVLGLLCVTFLGVESLNASMSFTDVTNQTGITFIHTDGSSENFYIMETVCAGLALFDYDNDGDIDIYFLNGAALKGTEYESPPKNALYRNDGNFKFTDVTDPSGTGDTGFGLGVTVGDYDNDGDPDLYLNNYGPNVLYRNNGNGTFTDMTEKAGVDDGSGCGAGTCFLDIENDGDLDLYVSKYVVFGYDKTITLAMGGHPVYPSPKAFVFPEDSLYRNNGDGTFTDISQVSGIGKYRGSGMGMVCADYDNDGDTDIFVLNDSMENFLFQNDGKGIFEEVGLLSGVAYDFNGKVYGNMGVDCADYDNDGLLDFYSTSYAYQWTTLYKNIGDGMFEDVTFTTGAGEKTFQDTTWGTGFADFDNDGDRDIFVAVGGLQPYSEKYNDRMAYLTCNEVFMNTGDGKFINITDQAGDGLKVKLSSRGAGFDDLDNDGDIDVVILNSRREPTILRNDTKNKNHWVQILLKGVKTNIDGVGARVKVVSGDLVQIDEVHSGRSYQSHYGTTLHFGLGKHEKIDRIEVKWTGGQTDILKNPAVNQQLTITEGENPEKK